MICMMCNNLGKNMDNVNNPVGQVKVKKNKLGTNNLEKQLTTTQSKTQLVLSQNHKELGICPK